MPTGVWLQEIVSLKVEDPDSLSARGLKVQWQLKGWALTADRITKLLSQLESSSQFYQVRLMAIQSLTAEEVRKQSKLRAIPLIQFTIVCRSS